MQESGSPSDFEQVRVELHNDLLIVRRDASRKRSSSRGGDRRKNVSLCVGLFLNVYIYIYIYMVNYIQRMQYIEKYRDYLQYDLLFHSVYVV